MADNNSWFQDYEKDTRQLQLEKLITEIKMEAIGLKYSIDNSIFTRNSMANSINSIIQKCDQIK